MKQYYSYGDGQKQEGDDEHIHGDPTQLEDAQWGTFGIYDFISEGDSPAFFHLIDVGLDNLENPQWGGWGGRLIQSEEQPNRWEDGENVRDFNPFTGEMDATFPQIRWVEAIQQDFAARADWCVMDYAEANHPPTVKAKGSQQVMAKSGEVVSLEVEASDPDGDELEINFWIYQEVGSYSEKVELTVNQESVKVQLAETGTGELHVIAEVRDRVVHPMTRYVRFLIKVED